MLYALAVLGGDAGTVRTADDDGLLKELGSGSADVAAGTDDLAGLKAHGAAGVANALYLTDSLDIVAGINGGKELYLVIRAEQAFVTVIADKKLGSDIAKQMKHMCAVYKVSAIMCVLSAHSEPDS